MYLKHVSALNLKGANLDLDLTRATAIVGENHAGKSRITDAVRLLLVGHLPELGRKPSATFGLSSGAFMEVAGVFDAGDGSRDLVVRRRWWLDGDSVRSEHQVPEEWQGLTSLSVMLNAEEYFGLSDRDRVEYVFANVPGAEVDLEGVFARLRKDAPGFEPETPPGAEDFTAQEALTHNLNRAVDESKRAKDWAKRMEETVRGLTGLRAQDPVGGARKADLQDERARVEGALNELREKKGRLIGAYTQQKSDERRRADLQREIQHGQKDALTAADLREKEAHLVAGVGAFAGSEVTLEALQARQDEVSALAIRLAEKRRALQSAKEAADATAAELAGIGALTACPTCGACGEGWRDFRVAELAARAEQQAAAVRAATEEAYQATRAESDARKAFTVAQGAFASQRNLRQGLDQVRGQLATLAPRLARLDALREQAAAIPAPDPALAEAVDGIQGEINAREQEARSLESVMRQVDARDAELGRLAAAEGERDRALADREKWERAVAALRAVQAELVESAFRPLLAAANAFFPGLLRAQLDYRRGEIGMWVEGAWVAHGTFSGTEKALTYAAIQAALAARSPVRVMLLDELGRLTERNAKEVARFALKAIDDNRLDQFFGVDPERGWIYKGAIGDPSRTAPTEFEVVTVHR